MLQMSFLLQTVMRQVEILLSVPRSKRGFEGDGPIFRAFTIVMFHSTSSAYNNIICIVAGLYICN